MNLSYSRKISKQALKSLISGFENIHSKEIAKVKSEKITKEYLPCEKCSTCDIVNERPDFCENYCSDRIVVVKDENSSIKLTETKYLSYDYKCNKNVIKQYLYYYFLITGTSNNRIRRNVKVKDTAKYLGTTTTTVKANNLILSQLGLIHLTNIFGNENDIIIVGEDKLHLKKSEGGTGYLFLTLKELNHLLNINNVADLRAEIAAILVSDGTKKYKSVNFNIDVFKKYFPKYMVKSKSFLKKILTKCKIVTLQENEKDSSLLKIDRYKYNVTLKDIQIKLKDKFKEFMYNNDLAIFDSLFPKETFNNLSEENKNTARRAVFEQSLNDLVKLAIEFSYEQVISNLFNLSEFYSGTDEQIENLGALLRTYIENSLERFGCNSSITMKKDIFTKDLFDLKPATI